MYNQYSLYRRTRKAAGSIGTFALAACLTSGCAGGPGSPFSAFSPLHKLLDSAKEMKDAAPIPAAVPRELDKRPQPPYIVEPGDVLLVLPADVDSPVRLPSDQPVMPDGTIQLGKYGRLQVAGKTVDDIEAAVKAQIDVKDAGAFTVRVVTRQSKVYYVLGEVNAPGAYQLSGRETVLDAILAAGGLTGRASRDDIIMDRPTAPDSCRTVLPVCWSEIVQLGDTSTNYQLAAGDRVYVPVRACWTFGKKKKCSRCNRPQTACPIPACGDGGVVLEGALPPSTVTGPWIPAAAEGPATKP